MSGMHTCGQYVSVQVGQDHHLANGSGCAHEHRVVMERVLGRQLSSDEIVHHINGDRADNRPCNLVLCTRQEHVYLHHPDTEKQKPGEENIRVKCACGCGQSIWKFGHEGRPRLYAPGCHPTRGKSKYSGDKRVPCACGCETLIAPHDRHGRQRRFANGHNVRESGRLTAKEVREIRAALQAGSHGIGSALAEQYGTTEQTISQIKYGRRFQWVR